MKAKLQVLVAFALGFAVSAFNDRSAVHDRSAVLDRSAVNGGTSAVLALEKFLWKLAPEAAAKPKESAPKALRSALAGATDPASKELSDQLTDLVMSKAEAAFGATPFGESVKRIIGLIEERMYPKVLDAHKADEEELERLDGAIKMCRVTKTAMIGIADKSKNKYLKFSPLHKTCRTGQAGLLTSKQEACAEKMDKASFLQLKQQAYDLVDARLKDQEANKQIMHKEGGESTESYMNRIADTICGTGDDDGGEGGEGGEGGGGGGGSGVAAACGTSQCGFRCQYQCAKRAKEDAEKDYDLWTEKCAKISKQFDDKVTECDNLQDQMDAGACKRAVDMKDACETYAECYTSSKQAYLEAEHVVKNDEKDRQSEWIGLKKMHCLMQHMVDGKIEDGEIKKCQDLEVDVSRVTIDYPKMDDFDECVVPKTYPTTSEYKKAEFAPLPALAKGKEDSNECTGVLEIATTPASGSPTTCKCERVTLNGPYSPGPMVKCTQCTDYRKATDPNSCPVGTKLFAPQTREDWKTFLASTEPLRDPDFIIDITRPQNGCAGCSDQVMNSNNAAQQSIWHTQDKAPWWLRSIPFEEHVGDYHANCFLDLWDKGDAGTEDGVTFKASNCDYHSKSYFCQLESVSIIPKEGSPRGCRCKKVEMTGPYSPGLLIKCMGCLEVSKSTQKNSCPKGSKIFSPRTRADWKTFIDSATPIRAPAWIIDVTRPADGCGGCSEAAMNSDDPAQKTWRTSDGSAWWLRSTVYTEPSGDYQANCYLDLWQNPENENSVGFNDMNCGNFADSYYCQSVKEPDPPPAPPAPPSPPPAPPPAEGGGDGPWTSGEDDYDVKLESNPGMPYTRFEGEWYPVCGAAPNSIGQTEDSDPEDLSAELFCKKLGFSSGIVVKNEHGHQARVELPSNAMMMGHCDAGNGDTSWPCAAARDGEGDGKCTNGQPAPCSRGRPKRKGDCTEGKEQGNHFKCS